MHDAVGIVYVELMSSEAMDRFKWEDGKDGPEEAMGILHLTC